MPAPSTELIGYGFPAVRGQDGYFTPKRGYDQAWADLLLVLFTPIGSRAFNRDFGSALHLVLFEPNDAELSPLVEYIVRECVSKWLPYIRIVAVQVGRTKQQVSVAVAFTLSTDANVESRSVHITPSNLADLTGMAA